MNIFRFNLNAVVLSMVCTLAAGCGGGASSTSNDATSTDSTAVVERSPLVDSLWAISDTTLYGRACGMGQSALTFVTESGDSLDLALSDDEGHDALIVGDREDTARYALTLMADGHCVRTIVNLSQLDRHVQGYALHNGRLALPDSTGRLYVVTVEMLTDEAFEAVNENGVRVSKP